MTEPISYDDLATFFTSNYDSTCETKSRIDRIHDDREVNYLECSTPVYGLSTFTVTLDGINSFADLTCVDIAQMSSKKVFTCWSRREDDQGNFELAFEKFENGTMRAVGGFIDAEAVLIEGGMSFVLEDRRADKLLDFLGSVYLGWYWATPVGAWYTMEEGVWQGL